MSQFIKICKNVRITSFPQKKPLKSSLVQKLLMKKYFILTHFPAVVCCEAFHRAISVFLWQNSYGDVDLYLRHITAIMQDLLQYTDPLSEARIYIHFKISNSCCADILCESNVETVKSITFYRTSTSFSLKTFLNVASSDTEQTSICSLKPKN